MGQKSLLMTIIKRFRIITQVWICWWLWNDSQSLNSVKEVHYCFPGSSIKFQCQVGQLTGNFLPNWAFPDCNPSNFKYTRDIKISPILNWIGHFRTVNPVWIHWWFEMMHNDWRSREDNFKRTRKMENSTLKAIRNPYTLTGIIYFQVPLTIKLLTLFLSQRFLLLEALSLKLICAYWYRMEMHTGYQNNQATKIWARWKYLVNHSSGQQNKVLTFTYFTVDNKTKTTRKQLRTNTVSGL